MDYNKKWNKIHFLQVGGGFMIIMFLVLNTIIFLSTSLGVFMFNNNLKRLSKSIDIYLDPKAYKPESEVRFISGLLDKYSRYENKELVDLDSLIMECFYSTKIGKFKVSVIETLANKGKRLLWVSIIAMVLYEALTVGLGRSTINSIIIIVSSGLGITLVLLEMYLNLEMGKKQLFLKSKNYLNNEYPQLKISQKEKEEVSILLTKIDQLEKEIRKHEEIKPLHKQEEVKIKKDKIAEEKLEEEDIVQILNYFDMFT